MKINNNTKLSFEGSVYMFINNMQNGMDGFTLETQFGKVNVSKCEPNNSDLIDNMYGITKSENGYNVSISHNKELKTNDAWLKIAAIRSLTQCVLKSLTGYWFDQEMVDVATFMYASKKYDVTNYERYLVEGWLYNVLNKDDIDGLNPLVELYTVKVMDYLTDLMNECHDMLKHYEKETTELFGTNYYWNIILKIILNDQHNVKSSYKEASDNINVFITLLSNTANKFGDDQEVDAFTFIRAFVDEYKFK